MPMYENNPGGQDSLNKYSSKTNTFEDMESNRTAGTGNGAYVSQRRIKIKRSGYSNINISPKKPPFPEKLPLSHGVPSGISSSTVKLEPSNALT